MQRKTRNRVLLLLLALLFGARTLTAQTGWQFFTVEGTGGDLGMLSVQFNDAANNVYAATFMYDQADTPTTAAASLASILIANYGTNVFSATSDGSTLAIAFTPYTIHNIGNGYFYNVYATPPSLKQSMYVINNSFNSPAPTGSSAPPPSYDTATTTTQNADGSVTIGTNSPPVEPGTVSVVGSPIWTDNPDGSTTMTTTYSDGTITATTYGANIAAAAADSNAAVAAAQGDTNTAASLQSDAAAATATAYANAAEANAEAAAAATAQGNSATAQAYANAATADAQAAAAISASLQAQAAANPAAAYAANAAQEAAATAAFNAVSAQSLANNGADTGPGNDGNGNDGNGNDGGGCGASCGSGGDYDPCGDWA